MHKIFGGRLLNVLLIISVGILIFVIYRKGEKEEKEELLLNIDKIITEDEEITCKNETLSKFCFDEKIIEKLHKKWHKNIQKAKKMALRNELAEGQMRDSIRGRLL